MRGQRRNLAAPANQGTARTSMAKLYFYYSSMNAGKSTALLQASYNYRERGMNTLLLTPAIDDRYGEGVVTSRIGLQSEASIIDPSEDIYDKVGALHEAEAIHCVLVDEAQFLSHEQVLQLARVCDYLDIPVLAYGLRTDFLGEPFEGSKYLLALSDNLKEIKAICYCGSKATMVVRQDEHGKVITAGVSIEVGGNERYVSMCRKHYFEAIAAVES